MIRRLMVLIRRQGFRLQGLVVGTALYYDVRNYLPTEGYAAGGIFNLAVPDVLNMYEPNTTGLYVNGVLTSVN